MAKLTYVTPSIGGTAAAPVAASGGGDTVAPGNNSFIRVTNGGGSSINVTVAVPGNTKYGQAQPDVVVAVAAGVAKLIGVLPADLADPSDGLVHITYSSVTSVTVEAIQTA